MVMQCSHAFMVYTRNMCVWHIVTIEGMVMLLSAKVA